MMTESDRSDTLVPYVVVVNKAESTEQPFSKSKLLQLLTSLSFDLDTSHLKLQDLSNKICKLLPPRLNLNELFDLVSETIAARTIYHPDHAMLAGRVTAKKIQQMLKNVSFSENVASIDSMVSNTKSTLLSEKFVSTVSSNADFFDRLIRAERDFDFSFFGIKTLEKSYLLKVGAKSENRGYRRKRDFDGGEVEEGGGTRGDESGERIVETPQFMFLRVAIGIHGDDLNSVKETYDLMSQRYFIHASPTLYNAGSDFNYLSSCFLVAMEDDSIDGIFKTLHTTALVSKASGGIGLHVHNIRANGSHIASTNGTSSGLIPMLKVFNNTARYVDQGGNKRPGAFAIYLEPWHSDVFDVLNMKKNHGKEEMRARDLFFALWIPDLFMKRVKNDEDWTLFSPDETPGLSDCYGEDFERLYLKYEKDESKVMNRIKAQKLWYAIIQSQTETGGPYMLYKDSCNRKSNQQNLGTIKSSNLCCEIIEYSSPEETAVCNLGSLALPSFVTSVEEDPDNVKVDFKKIHHVTKILTRNLNKVIDVTKYPVPSAELSNKRHRPIAVGIQGLADLFLELRLPFDSEDAKRLNIQIFETIYHAAIETSIELAISEGKYESFEGSPASKGLLQFDLWNHKPSQLYDDWDELKAKVQKYGLRNSLLVAPMPTASTSQILGFNECFEPYTSNIYTRRVLSGEYQVVNKYLLRDLIDLGIWNSAMKDKILIDNGSIQNIASIPQEIKDLYKTVWEIPQRTIIDMAADRGKFIDQSQSMNIYMKNPTLGKLTSCHFYGWEKGLKTGMYYLRTQAAARAIQFTVNNEEIKNLAQGQVAPLKRRRYEKTEHLERAELQGEDEKGNVSGVTEAISEITEDSYDIHDTTPVACELTNTPNCESCSG